MVYFNLIAVREGVPLRVVEERPLAITEGEVLLADTHVLVGLEFWRRFMVTLLMFVCHIASNSKNGNHSEKSNILPHLGMGQSMFAS